MISTVISSPSSLIAVVSVNAESALTTTHHTNMGSETAISWEEEQKSIKITKNRERTKQLKIWKGKS